MPSRASLFLPERNRMSQSLTSDPNQAVDRCWTAYHQAYRNAIAAGKSGFDAKDPARDAYLRAMPRLGTRDEIRGFLACVANAMLFDIVFRSDGPYLLAAARAAAAALPRESRPIGRPKPQPDPSTEELIPPVLEK